jgi:hypothetical protein
MNLVGISNKSIFAHALILILLLLAGGETWQGLWGGVPPLLGIGLLILTLRKEPAIFSLPLLFVYGVFYDAVIGTPLGFHPLFLLGYKTLLFLKPNSLKSFAHLMIQTSFMLILYLCFLWLSYRAQSAAILPLMIQGGLTILLLPAVSMLLEKVQRRV